jgi:hypothetical protein
VRFEEVGAKLEREIAEKQQERQRWRDWRERYGQHRLEKARERNQRAMEAPSWRPSAHVFETTGTYAERHPEIAAFIAKHGGIVNKTRENADGM